MWIYFVFGLWSLFAITGAVIARNRGAGADIGFVFGLLFGPFGLIFAYYLGDDDLIAARLVKTGQRKQCPACKELARVDAEICPRCRHDFTALDLQVPASR